MTVVVIALIAGVIFGMYVALHSGAGHAHYRHQRAGCARTGHRKARVYASLARGPYVRMSVPVGGGFRISHKL